MWVEILMASSGEVTELQPAEYPSLYRGVVVQW